MNFSEISIEKYGNMPIVNRLRNYLLDGQYIIKEKLAQGSFGHVFDGFDLLNGKKSVIIKFTQSHEININEYDTLMEI